MCLYPTPGLFARAFFLAGILHYPLLIGNGRIKSIKHRYVSDIKKITLGIERAMNVNLMTMVTELRIWLFQLRIG